MKCKKVHSQESGHPDAKAADYDHATTGKVRKPMLVLDKQTTDARSPYNHTYARRPLPVHLEFYSFWADGHGRQPSESSLYFCKKDGTVFRLPQKMEEEFAFPEPVQTKP